MNNIDLIKKEVAVLKDLKKLELKKLLIVKKQLEKCNIKGNL